MSLLDRLVAFGEGRSEKAAENLLSALDQAGGVDYLAEAAEKNPKVFLAIIGWVLEDQLPPRAYGE